jgi:beta-glucanase (GH16 family)
VPGLAAGTVTAVGPPDDGFTMASAAAADRARPAAPAAERVDAALTRQAERTTLKAKPENRPEKSEKRRKPTAEPTASPEPTTEPTTEPVTDTAAAPVTEPTTEPVTEPVTEPAPVPEPAPTTEPTATTATTQPVTTAAASGPSGVQGTWTQVWGDEFAGTSLDLTKWEGSWFGGGEMNNVATSESNVTVADGVASLQLSSADTGALIHTAEGDGRYALQVGEVVEARVWFPGNGEHLYNWPAFWANDTYDDTSGMPLGGEHDIAEVLSSHDLTVNYHSPSGAHNQGSVDGYWGDAWHVYTLHRKADSADVYYDGQLVKSYPTDDSGTPLDVIFNVGTLSSDVDGVSPVTGPEGALRIDWVRAYAPGG